MVAVCAPVAAPPRTSLGSTRSRRTRPPELLACAGVAIAFLWPWAVLSPTHVVIVLACLLPLGLRTLIDMEEALMRGAIPAPAPLLTELADPGYRTSFELHQAALALIDVHEDGAAVIADQNLAFERLAARLGGEAPPAGDAPGPERVFTVADGVRLRTQLAELAAGRIESWQGTLELAPDPDAGAELAQVLLSALTGPPARISLTLLRLGPTLPDGPAPALAALAGEDVPAAAADEELHDTEPGESAPVAA